jgi:hypothetical protein
VPNYITDPVFHGDNKINQITGLSNCSTFATGAAATQWQDETEEGTMNTEVTQSSVHAYTGNYSVKIKLLNLAACKASLRIGSGLTIGTEYEFHYKVFIPTEGEEEDGDPPGICAAAGTTLAGFELGQTDVYVANHIRGEWLQSPVLRFTATGTGAYFVFLLICDDAGTDYVYVDDIKCSAKSLTWT